MTKKHSTTTPKGGKNHLAKELYCDEPKTGQCAEDVLATARLNLIMRFPFFGKVAQNMSLVESNAVPTTAVDAKGRLYFNRKWVNHFDENDALFEMGHEAMHMIQRCFGRFPKGGDPGLWNRAADYLCDTSLIDAGMKQSDISLQEVTPDKVEMVHELGTIEAVYKKLLVDRENNTQCEACKAETKKMQSLSKKEDAENQAENKEINGNGDEESEAAPGHEHGDGEDCGGGEEELEHTCGGSIRMCCAGHTTDLSNATPMDEQKWLEKVVAAKMFAESKGNMPAGLSDQIEALTKSTVRWQEYIKTHATKIFGRDRYTHRRANRRSYAIKMRIPSPVPDGKSAVIAVDTSGSMSHDACRQCITEAAGIMRACGADKVWLILHDAVPYYSGYVTEADLTKLKMARGGTSHQGVFKILARKYENEKMNVPREEEVHLAVMFTDLGTDFPDTKPDFDVIWGVPVGGCPGIDCAVPFGLKVPVELNEGP
jgi:predicted metal-dependent peptidase